MSSNSFKLPLCYWSASSTILGAPTANQTDDHSRLFSSLRNGAIKNQLMDSSLSVLCRTASAHQLCHSKHGKFLDVSLSSTCRLHSGD